MRVSDRGSRLSPPRRHPRGEGVSVGSRKMAIPISEKRSVALLSLRSCANPGAPITENSSSPLSACVSTAEYLCDFAVFN